MYVITAHHNPPTLAAALELLAADPALLPIAGGTDLLVRQRHRRSSAAYLRISQLEALRGVSRLADGALSIGAACTFAELAGHTLIQTHAPILVEAALSMGGPQVRNVTTVGGNLCNGAVSADSAPALLALEAELQLVSREGARTLPAENFYCGPGVVDLRQGELLTRIIVPARPAGEGGCYLKYSMRRAMDIATLGVAAVCTITENGQFGTLGLAAGVMARTPLRLRGGEAAGVGKMADADTAAMVAATAVADTSARTSWRASKEFREHILAVYCKRAVLQAIGRAQQ